MHSPMETRVRHRPSLSTFIEDVRVYVPEGRPAVLSALPDGTATILFRITEEPVTPFRLGACDLSLIGPRTKAMFKVAHPVPLAVAVRFKPAGLPAFLGVPMSSLTDRLVPLGDIWGRGAVELLDRLREAGDVASIVERLQQALLSRARDTIEPTSVRLARRAVRRLRDGRGASIRQVAVELGVSDRHLRRAFVEGVGVGPREFARMLRLQHAVTSAAASSDWAGIAIDAGYYDQSHMISDFRDLVGMTPRALISGANPPRQC